MTGDGGPSTGTPVELRATRCTGAIGGALPTLEVPISQVTSTTGIPKWR